jgi:hypothetical protein
MEQFNGRQTSTDEDKNISKADIITHFLTNDPAQGVHAFTHIRFARTQKIAHRTFIIGAA